MITDLVRCATQHLTVLGHGAFRAEASVIFYLLFLGSSADGFLSLVYANSLLAMYVTLNFFQRSSHRFLSRANGRQGLQNRLDQSLDLRIPSGVFFCEPDQVSLVGAHLKDTYTPEREPKYSGHMITDPFASPTRQRYIGIPLSDPFSPGSETKYSPTDSEGASLLNIRYNYTNTNFYLALHCAGGKSLSRTSSRSHTV